MVNWNKIFNSTSVDNIKAFAKGQMSKTQFAKLCPETRRLVRDIDVDSARSMARSALYRRTS